MRAASLVVLAVAGAGLARAQAQRRPSRAPSFPLSAGVKVVPETVLVGDPFVVTVAVRAPRGATMSFPEVPDSTSAVQALDRRRVARTRDTTADEEFATYRVAAWDVGPQPINLGDVVVKFSGAERRVPVGGYKVFVRSVLPADSAQRTPKPPRPLFEFGPPLWWWWVVALAAALIVTLLLWWWRRRRKPPIEVAEDPFERAEREFAYIESLGLLEAGERGRYVTLMIEILRDYLAARYERAALSLTSNELLLAVRGERAIPYDRLSRVLDEADLVKFARRPLSNDRARELGREARGIVVSERHASRPVEAAGGERAA